MGYTPPYLDVRQIAGGIKVYAPSSTSTDDLYFYPNTTDSYCSLRLNGNAGLSVAHAAGSAFELFDATVCYILFQYTTPDAIINCYTANKNLFLKTAGTGLVKFGAYTAGAATDSTGYITILDAAGNTRKLMVQA